MKQRELGNNGPRVSAIGLGCMAFSGGYGATDDAESIATIHVALDAGITYLDSGDFYGMGHNEILLCEALKGRARQALQRIEAAVPKGAVAGTRYGAEQMKSLDSETH